MFLLNPIEAYYLIKSMWQNVVDGYIDYRNKRMIKQNFYQWQAKEEK